ncbi:MAG: hypothetical protein RBU27_04455 [Bacteroidota bacterium]|jgi:hypothetical protein|nr:hypothetical protein [Bacteroidota bacterium]
MNGMHLTDIAILVLVASGQTHPHLDECAFCREQYEALRRIDEAERDTATSLPEAAEPHAPFRLAAQGMVDAPGDHVALRHTWYLEGGRVILRVLEEQDGRLVGYVICTPERLPSIRIHFSGLDTVYVPSADGSFVIGDVGVAIDAMHVTLETP